MKRSILVLAIFAMSMTANAQKVALHSSTGVQHFNGISGFQNAYNAASSGDTIYLPGGSFNVPSFIDKGILIFGAGHYPDSTLVTGKTILNSDLTLKENADNFYIEGVEINGNILFENNKSINQVTVIRCKMSELQVLGDLSAPSTNLSLIGSVFNALRLPNAQNVLISNNIIRYGIDNTNGNMISNNIFLSVITIYYTRYNYTGSNNQLSNNIFLAQPEYMTNGTGNEYYNNLLAFSNPSYGTGSTTIGNYTGVDPASIFINQSGNNFDYSHNYHLQNPTTYLGNDGSEVGIYGGTYPYKEGAVPSNPHFQQQNIAPTTSNGLLNVQIKAAAQEQ